MDFSFDSDEVDIKKYSDSVTVRASSHKGLIF